MNLLLSTTPILHLILVICFFSHVQPLCHKDESTALLQFKASFDIDKHASTDPLAYPKVASWILDDKDDCCSWDGVECDENNTHVIGLHLNSSCLHGSIDSSSSIFLLSHLQTLNLADNDFNYSEIPSWLGYLQQLTFLNLSSSVFAGQIPLEISQLSNLTCLDLSANHLVLKQPNFSTLVQNLSKLEHLGLNNVDISSLVPSFLANFSSLTSIFLDGCGLYGEFPNVIFQLPNLQFLGLSENENLTGSIPEFRSNNPLRELWLQQTAFSGPIPSSIGNLDSLNVLSLTRCAFSGQFPSSLGRLSKLRSLNVNMNSLSGTVDFNMFLNMKNLTRLLVSNNNLSVIMERSTSWNINATVPKFEVLNLASCNLTTFPDFLRYQDRLKILDLSKNHIQGKVPEWIWNTSIEALFMSSNLFTGFGSNIVIPSHSLRILELHHNSFTGPLPIPPASIVVFDILHNELSGEISPLVFNSSSLELLDLSHNKLGGVLPECFRSIKHNLSSRGVLQTCQLRSQLQVMDLSYNQFQGCLPRSLLANCMKLKVLKLENNHFNDVYPSRLGTLPQLKVLQLQSNHFHGAITSNSASHYEFPSLQIIDLSHNNLSGRLPSDLFQRWNAMKDFDVNRSSYLGTRINLTVAGTFYQYFYPFSVTITNVGKDMVYQMILEVFTVIDLSSNRFQGDIPEYIGNLRGLQVLNLSNNMLDGSIPSSLSNITKLESLDLSLNKLSGEIPRQLLQLTFLAFFNVSFNCLRGLIPQGSQFSTFDSSSYMGNVGLQSLLHVRISPRASPSALGSSKKDNQDSRSWFESNWVTILPGFVGGLIFGVAMEQILAIDKRVWFINAFNLGVVAKTKGRRGRKFQRTT